jgi:hypothetical protein
VAAGKSFLYSLNYHRPEAYPRYSILPALSLDGILDVAVIEGMVNTEVFLEFLRGLTLEMNPYPEKNSVLVMDNVKFHLAEDVRNLLDER